MLRRSPGTIRKTMKPTSSIYRGASSRTNAHRKVFKKQLSTINRQSKKIQITPWATRDSLMDTACLHTMEPHRRRQLWAKRERQRCGPFLWMTILLKDTTRSDLFWQWLILTTRPRNVSTDTPSRSIRITQRLITTSASCSVGSDDPRKAWRSSVVLWSLNLFQSLLTGSMVKFWPAAGVMTKASHSSKKQRTWIRLSLPPISRFLMFTV